MSQELDEEANEHTRQDVHHYTCSNLFGCGDEKGIGILREDIKERAFDNRASDRLLHMDEIDQANLEGYLSARGRGRRKFLQASSFHGRSSSSRSLVRQACASRRSRQGRDRSSG